MAQAKGEIRKRHLVRDVYCGPQPPSYMEATTSGSPTTPKHFEPHSGQASIELLLNQYPLQVRRALQDQLSQQMDDENLLVEHMGPCIADFFHNTPASILSQTTPQGALSAELILLPMDGAPATQGWTLSDLDQRKIAAHVRVAEVTAPGKDIADSPDQKHPGGDGEDLMWWHDEGLAGRLASRIRSYLPEARNAGDTDNHAGPMKTSVQAEEVTLRRETDMGLWESSSGWAIILRLSMRI
ncbi:hypothetical protein VMCG_04252 [Cytospora schulzeri]|uniref:Uncharacterized protein n=1 Tax=Cytospora schulzeri TaxID=448051 RepID=A0A423WSZ3_9PEZI|nr:hypothetical protein VMCG_04252 [Valsa malicola]